MSLWIWVGALVASSLFVGIGFLAFPPREHHDPLPGWMRPPGESQTGQGRHRRVAFLDHRLDVDSTLTGQYYTSHDPTRAPRVRHRWQNIEEPTQLIRRNE